MSITLEIVNAPLTDDYLAALGGLYGSRDPKYMDATYVRRLTEDNPSGSSSHVFARQGERFVGHYAVIPLEIVRAGDRQMSSKGEAYFVDEAVRQSKTVEGIPTGIALLKASFEAAEAAGSAMIHCSTRSEVGILARLNGCRELRLPMRQYTVLLDAPRRPQLGKLTRQELMKAGLTLGQRFARVGWSAVSQLSGGVRRETAPVFYNESPDLQRRWDVAWGDAQHEWMGEFLASFRMRDDPSCYAVVRRPLHATDAVRLLEWRCPPNAWRRACLLLSSVLHAAAAWGASRVLFTEHVTGCNEALRRAARLTGFFVRDFERLIYVRSKDPFYSKLENMRWTPYPRVWF